MKKTLTASNSRKEGIEEIIYIIRGQKVMLDMDLAKLYGVATKVFNQAIQRNIGRFPPDFAFQLDENEWKVLRSQIVTSKNLKESRGGRQYRPYVFTEQGVAMLSSILRSPRAIQINIEIMRTFVRLRHVMTCREELGKELMEIKSFLIKHSHSTDREFRKVWQAIEKLSERPDPQERRIGFQIND